jgi:protein-S-isoprenylcysteine O-methyltransferase Ste14
MSHLVQVLTMATFSSWALTFVFYFHRSDSAQSRERSVLAALGLITIGGELFAYGNSELSTGRSTVALALLVGSNALFVWALATAGKRRLHVAFAEVASQQLLTRGPYQFVRHPIYLAYSVGWLSGVVATMCWWLLLPIGALIYYYVVASIAEERSLLMSPLGHAYAEYARRVPNPFGVRSL